MEDAPHPERGRRIFPFGHGLRVSVGFARLRRKCAIVL